MFIKEVFIDGLLSFKNFRVSLTKDMNILVGNNGVGKTNFISIVLAILQPGHKSGHYLKDIAGDIMIYNNKFYIQIRNK